MLVRFALTLDVHRGIIQSLSSGFHRADLCLPASRSCQYKSSGSDKLISGRGPYESEFLGLKIFASRNIIMALELIHKVVSFRVLRFAICQDYVIDIKENENSII